MLLYGTGRSPDLPDQSGHLRNFPRSSGASLGRAASSARCRAMSRSMSAKIGLEFGLVADRGEARVEVTGVAPHGARQPAFSASRSATSASLLGRAGHRSAHPLCRVPDPRRGIVRMTCSLRSSNILARSISPVFCRTGTRSIATRQFVPSILGGGGATSSGYASAYRERAAAVVAGQVGVSGNDAAFPGYAGSVQGRPRHAGRPHPGRPDSIAPSRKNSPQPRCRASVSGRPRSTRPFALHDPGRGREWQATTENSDRPDPAPWLFSMNGTASANRFRA